MRWRWLAMLLLPVAFASAEEPTTLLYRSIEGNTARVVPVEPGRLEVTVTYQRTMELEDPAQAKLFDLSFSQNLCYKAIFRYLGGEDGQKLEISGLTQESVDEQAEVLVTRWSVARSGCVIIDAPPPEPEEVPEEEPAEAAAEETAPGEAEAEPAASSTEE